MSDAVETDVVRSAPLRLEVLTLFPQVFEPYLSTSVLGKGIAKGALSVGLHQIRDHSLDKHRTVDDTPYGGGAGMVLRVDVLHKAWSAVRAQVPTARTVLLSPQGPKLTVESAKRLAASEQLILVCGHYEGVDERFIELCVDEELSIGDYVLTGGELAALVVIDAVSRWIPGVVGRGDSVLSDSLEEGGTLKHAQYTRPAEFMGLSVPEILMSGNHPKIEAHRRAERVSRTRRKRPDLGSK
jgi:tRNA (guanine37-N1)-methyltransferase